MAKIRVEYVWDGEAKAWGFVVPALHIVGGNGGRILGRGGGLTISPGPTSVHSLSLRAC
jgi:hypothetical protein